jgi:predicted nucleic acid-binding protein
MIAADTSSFSAFLDGDQGPDALLVAGALEQDQLLLPPVVVTEILSSTRLSADDAAELAKLPTLEVTEGYWERAGTLRRALLSRRFKSRLADALIAQSCIDHDIALITRDRDFRRYVSAGLQLLP